MVQDLDKDDSKNSEFVIKSYRERLTLLKKAQEYSKKNDIPKAVEKYANYLNVLAAYYRIPEEQLRPSMFDRDRDITELLLISHAYWDLAKAYDRSPRLVGESIRCLDQFVRFTEGNKFQYVNAQMAKKFIKKKHAYHPKNFQSAYKKLYVKGKSCFVATYCYGENHSSTNFFRSYRDKISSRKIGMKFIELYYDNSPQLINFCNKNPFIGKILKGVIFLPLLWSIQKFLLTYEKFNVYFKKAHN